MDLVILATPCGYLISNFGFSMWLSVISNFGYSVWLSVISNFGYSMWLSVISNFGYSVWLSVISNFGYSVWLSVISNFGYSVWLSVISNFGYSVWLWTYLLSVILASLCGYLLSLEYTLMVLNNADFIPVTHFWRLSWCKVERWIWISGSNLKIYIEILSETAKCTMDFQWIIFLEV